MFTEVSAPIAATPQAVNLLASAIRPDDESGTAWMDGLVWRSESCPTAQGVALCAEPSDPLPADSGGLVYVRPVGYRVGVTCSTLSGDIDRQIATRQADAVASFFVARELWTGELSQEDPFDTPGGGSDLVNPYLANADATTIPAQADLMTALAELEAATREKTRGAPVFLHAPIRLIARIGQNLHRVGNELRTATDAVVVADAGYDGTGPAGTGDSWMYGTGPVVARLGPVVADTADASTIDRRGNTRQIIASRLFAVGFDPCAHFAINVTDE